MGIQYLNTALFRDSPKSMTPTTPNRLEPGEIVEGRYRISQLVEAEGGTATYTAKHLLMGRNVTLQILCSDHHSALRRFRRSGRVLSMMRHPGIVGIHDMGMYDRFPYMSLEYLEGQSLAQRSAFLGAFDLESVRRIARQLLSAVAYVHDRKIFHRDISAQNVMIVEKWNHEETLKLGSFAFAKDLAASRSSTMSEKRSMIASLTHVAPEQILRPDETDHRVDIYATGAVLYQLLAGTAPFRGNTLAELGAAIMEETPRSLLHFSEEIPTELDAVIGQALAKEPAHRFETAGAMLKAIEAACAPALNDA